MTTGDRDVIPALDRLAEADVTELLAGVRADGLRLARARLGPIYADALVAAVTRQQPAQPAAPTPPAAEGARGCYVYAVVAGDGTGAADGVPGVEPGGPVGTVTVGAISAVVSDVDVEAVRAGAAEADVSEGGWLATAVRAHERVVVGAFRSAPTVPMRFGIVHPDRETVQELLRDHAEEFQAELDRISGAAEWSVKVYADTDRIDAALVAATSDGDNGVAAGDADAPNAFAGRAHLLRERARRDHDAQVHAVVAGGVQALTDALATLARDVVVKPAAASEQRRCVFSAACLVDRGDEQRLGAVVREFLADPRHDGLDVELDGPWPPYHFTRLHLEESRD